MIVNYSIGTAEKYDALPLLPAIGTMSGGRRLTTPVPVTAGATIKDFSKISHLKTTNTSVETVISINSPTAPVYVYNNNIELQEFGIVTRGQFYIGQNNFKYIGASLTNSHRFIILNGNAIESRIFDNTFECSLKQGTTS
jgi:hypothetical protein